MTTYTVQSKGNIQSQGLKQQWKTVQLADTDGDMTRGVGNPFQYFTTRTENAPILRRRRQ